MELNKISPFSRVRINCENNTYEGILLPNEDSILVLKMDSGYNVGFSVDKVTDVTILKENNKASVNVNEASSADDEKNASNDKKNVIIIHTGGTISSKVDYKTGAVVASFDPKSLLGMFPELDDVANIESDFIGNIMSDDIRFGHINMMAKAIEKRAKNGEKRFIVTQGTDFLHYTSSALAFMLKDLDVGVLVVGSQRSSDRPSSDAGMNLICAAKFLIKVDFVGVGVCMHESSDDDYANIIPGVNTRKMHSSKRDAFKSIKGNTIARVSFVDDKVEVLSELQKPKGSSGNVVYLNEDLKIGIVQSHPQFHACELKAYNDFDGLVFAGSGFGHFPITAHDDMTVEHSKIFEAIVDLAKNIPVVISTQTIAGEVNLDVYTPGRKLNDAGVIGNHSTMITETAFMKLAYILSFDKNKVSELFMTNMIGELDELRGI